MIDKYSILVWSKEETLEDVTPDSGIWFRAAQDKGPGKGGTERERESLREGKSG